MTAVQNSLQVRAAIFIKLIVGLIEQQGRMRLVDHAEERCDADRTIQFSPRRQSPKEVQRHGLAAVLAGGLKGEPRCDMDIKVFSLQEVR